MVAYGVDYRVAVRASPRQRCARLKASRVFAAKVGRACKAKEIELF